MKHPLFISKVFIFLLRKNNHWFLFCKSWTSLAFGHLFLQDNLHLGKQLEAKVKLFEEQPRAPVAS